MGFTIHKSQGLTFDNVIIDLGAGAFVNGQLYTALSRCRTLEGLTLKRKIQQKDIIEDKRLLRFYNDEIKGKSLVIKVEEFSDHISANDFFLLRLISTHHSFTMKDIINYGSILKWGSGVKTWYEGEEYYQPHSIAKYGLCFNSNIKWSDEILKYQKFEANSYQWTNYDENGFPLSSEDEIGALVDVITFHSKAPEYSSEEQEEEHYENLTRIIGEISEAATKEFNFSTLEDLVQFTNTCRGIYCMNKSLFENLLRLLRQRNINNLTVIFDELKTAHKMRLAGMPIGEAKTAPY